MTLSWSSLCIKYMLFVFNLLFVITGIVFLSVGISIKAYYIQYDTFLDERYFSTPNLLIAIGSIIFIISFLGCCGAIKENFCMIISFSTLLILVFILELAAGIAGYALRDTTEEYLVSKLNESMYKYNSSSGNEITRMWDLIQMNFECCGVNKPQDWINVTDLHKLIPFSCCGPQIGAVGSATCGIEPPHNKTLYTDGCVSKFGNIISSHALTLGGVGIAFAVIQLLGIIFACYLSKRVKQEYIH